MQPTENGQLNSDYAQEWISYLKRRNLLLTIAWPTLLALFILASLAAFYFYQSEKTTKLSLSLETEKIHTLEGKIQSLDAEVIALTATNSELKTELEALINAREELSVLNDDSESKLNITSQMVDNLNQLVIELKNERENLSLKLEESMEAYALLKNQHQQAIKQSAQDKNEALAQLNKDLSSRKTAYRALANRQQDMREDINRLNDLASTKDKQIDKLKKDNQTLSSKLDIKNKEVLSYKNRINVLENNYADLESKLNALVSPIGQSKGQSNTSKADQNLTSSQQTEASKNITGLEEIKKPKVQATSKNDKQDQAFDHNQISILP